MRIIECEQKSREWFMARVGVVTASEFDNIVSPGKLLPAKGAAYLHKLVAETVLGEPIETGDNAWTSRGTDMEPAARDWYSLERGVDIEQVGLCLRDDGRVGASPDGLIGDDGVLEAKVPAAHTHMGYLLDPASLAADYLGQTQGELYVTGRKWVDLLSWNPVLPPVIVRVTPSAAYRRALDPALDAFLLRLDEALAQVQPLVDARRASNPFI